MNWLAFTPIASAIIALTAATVAAWNARKTIQNADRQHGIAYAADINKWASDILKVLPRTMLLYTTLSERQHRRDLAVTLGNELMGFYDCGLFIFPDLQDERLVTLLKIIRAVNDDVSKLTDSDLVREDGNRYTLLRSDFIEAVRAANGVARRHADARRYLS